MPLPVERYRSHGEAGPAATYLGRAAKAGWALFFLVLGGQDAFLRHEPVPVAELEIGSDKAVRRSIVDRVENLLLPPLFTRTEHGIAYLTPALDTLHARRFATNEQYTANRHGHCTYEKVGTSIHGYDTKGAKLFIYKTSTYPRAVRTGQYYFLVTGDQAGLGFLRRDGKLVGPFQYFVPIITSYTYGERGECAYLGFIDGSLERFNIKPAKTAWRIRQASRYPVVKALALADDERSLCVVAGIEPETFALYDPDGKKQWSERTGGTLRTAISAFVGAGACFGHTERGIYLLERSSGSRRYTSAAAVETRGRIKHADFANPAAAGPAVFAYSHDDASIVEAVDAAGRLVYHGFTDGPYAFVHVSRPAHAFAVQTRDRIVVYRMRSY